MQCQAPIRWFVAFHSSGDPMTMKQKLTLTGGPWNPGFPFLPWLPGSPYKESKGCFLSFEMLKSGLVSLPAVIWSTTLRSGERCVMLQRTKEAKQRRQQVALSYVSIKTARLLINQTGKLNVSFLSIVNNVRSVASCTVFKSEKTKITSNITQMNQLVTDWCHLFQQKVLVCVAGKTCIALPTFPNSPWDPIYQDFQVHLESPKTKRKVKTGCKNGARLSHSSLR